MVLDIMDPYPRTMKAKGFFLVVTDMLFRWTEAFPIPTANLQIIAPLVEREVFQRWMYPQNILTDNAPQWRDQHSMNLCEG
jgi:hypothetical protein